MSQRMFDQLNMSGWRVIKLVGRGKDKPTAKDMKETKRGQEVQRLVISQTITDGTI